MTPQELQAAIDEAARVNTDAIQRMWDSLITLVASQEALGLEAVRHNHPDWFDEQGHLKP